MLYPIILMALAALFYGFYFPWRARRFHENRVARWEASRARRVR